MNLNRLKGSGLLVQGFDEFLANYWFKDQTCRDTPLEFNKEAAKVFELLPQEAKHFYRVLHKWPQANITYDDQHTQLVSSPRFADSPTWQEEQSFLSNLSRFKSNSYQLDEQYASLITIGYDIAEIVVNLDEESPFSVYTSGDLDYHDLDLANPLDQHNFDENWIKIDLALDELLIMFSFYKIVTAISFHMKETELPADVPMIFSSMNFDGRELEIYYKDQFLWLTDKTGTPIYGAQANSE